jgi:hypothetical protein
VSKTGKQNLAEKYPFYMCYSTISLTRKPWF